jgi:hypothetical protein
MEPLEHLQVRVSRIVVPRDEEVEEKTGRRLGVSRNGAICQLIGQRKVSVDPNPA